MTSHHADQLASTLRRAVQEILARGLHDPRVRGLITVTAVRVSPDLRNATVAVSVTPEKDEKLTLRGLQHAGSHIQSKVAGAISVRRMPHLSFTLDRALKKESQTLAAINRGSRREGRPVQEGGA
jgi:ribosome-binding factor A